MYEKTLKLMEITLHSFMVGLPEAHKPKIVTLPIGDYYRFTQKNLGQAIIMKLARAQSALGAAMKLLQNGFVQEFYILCRVIDETNVDIQFLSLGVIEGCTKLHEEFLDAFWMEEIQQPNNILDTKKGRPMIPRSKIRNYLVNIYDGPIDKSTATKSLRIVHQVTSGYVHGAAPQIMEMYSGEPMRFYVNGLLNTSRVDSANRLLPTYVYRVFLSHIFAAKAFGVQNYVAILTKHKEEFEQEFGIGEDHKKIERKFKIKK